MSHETGCRRLIILDDRFNRLPVREFCDVPDTKVHLCPATSIDNQSGFENFSAFLLADRTDRGDKEQLLDDTYFFHLGYLHNLIVYVF